MKIMVTSFKRSHVGIAALSASDPAAATADPHLHWRLLDTHGQAWVSLFWGHFSFLLGPGVHKVLFVPSESVSPVLCKFWGIYGGVNGALLQEDLRHTQVCCTQSPCPYGRPLLTRNYTGDTQTQFRLSLCGVSGSWCAQGFICSLQESVSPVCVSSGGSMVGLKATSSKRAYATPRSAAPRAPAPVAGHC